MRALLLLLSLLLLIGAAAAQKKPKHGGLYQLPQQTVSLPAPPTLQAAQPCANWAWAAAVEALLAWHKVPLDQQHWVLRLEGGLTCRELAHPLSLARAIGGSFVLEDRRKVRLELRHQPTLPASPEPLVEALRAGRPLIVLWNGMPHLLEAVVYDEAAAATGQRFFEIRELHLVDLLRPPGDAARQVRFVRDEHDATQLGGYMDIEVTELWPGRR